MFTLMLPCAGSSSRYPNMRPKWSLTHPNGRLMITQGISGIDFSNFDSICMAVLKTDLEKYKLRDAIYDSFKEFDLDFKLLELDEPTSTESNLINHQDKCIFSSNYAKEKFLNAGCKNTTSIPSVDKVLTKHTFAARIFYNKRQPEEIVDANAQMNLLDSDGKIRIKVKSDAYEKIKICSRIEVDDELYVVDGDPKIIGPFDAQFYSIYLKREN